MMQCPTYRCITLPVLIHAPCLQCQHYHRLLIGYLCSQVFHACCHLPRHLEERHHRERGVRPPIHRLHHFRHSLGVVLPENTREFVEARVRIKSKYSNNIFLCVFVYMYNTNYLLYILGLKLKKINLSKVLRKALWCQPLKLKTAYAFSCDSMIIPHSVYLNHVPCLDIRVIAIDLKTFFYVYCIFLKYSDPRYSVM